MCKNVILIVTYMKEIMMKVFHKSFYSEFKFITYMMTKFFFQRLYFYNQIRLLNEKKISSKRVWEIPKNKNEIFVSVATLA